LGSLFASLFPNTGASDAQKAYYEELTRQAIAKPKKDGGSITKRGIRLADGGMAPVGSEYHDGNGNFYDADGYLVE
jgi:major membrane immunogen (membrane-anchored lipoprotein)